MEYTKAFLLSVAIIVGERDVASSREFQLPLTLKNEPERKKKITRVKLGVWRRILATAVLPGTV